MNRCTVTVLALLSPLLAYAGAPPDDDTAPAYPADPVVDDTLQDLGIDSMPAELAPAVAEPAPPIAVSSAPERIIWNKSPIRITLPVGQERMVHFPGDVRVGFESPKPSDLRTQSVAGTVYWLAKQPFPTIRIQVQELVGGQIYLIDLQAQPEASSAPIQIMRPPELELSPKQTPTPSAPAPTHATVTFVQMTRFAAQQLYAPRRLQPKAAPIFRVPLDTQLVPLLRGGKVRATPLIAWRGGEYYVTAVQLRNITTQPVILDPRQLRGQWHAATFQHARLFPAGDEADTTCVYLISARPFAEAFRGLY